MILDNTWHPKSGPRQSEAEKLPPMAVRRGPIGYFDLDAPLYEYQYVGEDFIRDDEPRVGNFDGEHVRVRSWLSRRWPVLACAAIVIGLGYLVGAWWLGHGQVR